ncbi:MAG: NUDIX hydrolase [Dehalococcoidia bacterium]|nr:NUDIX hydrolase [Dehalococcoidia bacterium]
MKKWKTVSSTLAYSKRRVTVFEDIVELPNGEQTDYIVLKGGHAVAVLPITDDNRAVLVRQYRYPIDDFIIELPGGGTMKGETLEASARRELREELGLLSDDMSYLGHFYAGPSRSNTVVHLFVARGLKETDRALEPYEFIETNCVEWGELTRMVLANEIEDVATAYAVLLLNARSG